MVLANSLTTDMIEAAENIRQQLHGWKTSDETLEIVRNSFPGFDFSDVLIKATVINSLYGTNVYAIWKAAEHVHGTIAKYNLGNAETEFVEKIARVPGINRVFISFASKFAHFFIDSERFPIMDSHAVSAIKYHLGYGKWEKCSADRPYNEFVFNFTKLKDLCGFNGSGRDFEHYLWLAGLFKEWKKKEGKAEINQEVKDFFGNSDNQEIIQRAFEGEL